jgi:hypothetical protein
MSLDELVDQLVGEIEQAHTEILHARDALDTLPFDENVSYDEWNRLANDVKDGVIEAVLLCMNPMRTATLITQEGGKVSVHLKDSMIHIAGMTHEIRNIMEAAAAERDIETIKEELGQARLIAQSIEEAWRPYLSDEVSNGNPEYSNENSNGNVEHPQRTNVEGGRRKRLHKRTLRKRHNMRKQTHRKRK